MNTYIHTYTILALRLLPQASGSSSRLPFSSILLNVASVKGWPANLSTTLRLQTQPHTSPDSSKPSSSVPHLLIEYLPPDFGAATPCPSSLPALSYPYNGRPCLQAKSGGPGSHAAHDTKRVMPDQSPSHKQLVLDQARSELIMHEASAATLFTQVCVVYCVLWV